MNVTAEDLPEHVNAVLAAIARGLKGKRVLPENLAELDGQIRNCLSGHKTWTEHKPHSPKGSRPRLKAVYTIAISGPIFDGRWSFTPGHFDALLRTVDQSREAPELTTHDRPKPALNPMRRAIKLIIG